MLTINDNASQKMANTKKLFAALSSVAVIGAGAVFLLSNKKTLQTSSKLSEVMKGDVYGDFSVQYDDIKATEMAYTSTGMFTKTNDAAGEWDVEYYQKGSGMNDKWKDSYVLKDGELYMYALNQTYECANKYNNLGYAKYKYNIASATEVAVDSLTIRAQLRTADVCGADRSNVYVVENEDYGRLILCENQNADRTSVGIVGESFRGKINIFEGKTDKRPGDNIKFHTLTQQESGICENTDKFYSQTDAQIDEYKDILEKGENEVETSMDIARYFNFPFGNANDRKLERKLKGKSRVASLEAKEARTFSDDDEEEAPLSRKDNMMEFYVNPNDFTEEGRDDKNTYNAYWDSGPDNVGPAGVMGDSKGGGGGGGGGGPTMTEYISKGPGKPSGPQAGGQAIECKGPCPTMPPTDSPTPYPTNPPVTTAGLFCHMFHGAGSHKGYRMRYQNGTSITEEYENNNGGVTNTFQGPGVRTWGPSWKYPNIGGITWEGFHWDSAWGAFTDSPGLGIGNLLESVGAGVIGGLAMPPKAKINWGGKMITINDQTTTDHYYIENLMDNGAAYRDPLSNCDLGVTFAEMNTSELTYKSDINRQGVALQVCGNGGCECGPAGNQRSSIFAHSMGGQIIMGAIAHWKMHKGPNCFINLVSSPIQGAISANFAHWNCNDANNYGGALKFTLMLAFSATSTAGAGLLAAIATLLTFILYAIATCTIPRDAVRVVEAVMAVCNNNRTGGQNMIRELRIGVGDYYWQASQYGVVDHKMCGLSPDGLEGFGWMWRALNKTMCQKDDFCLQMRCSTDTSYICHYRGCSPPNGWKVKKGLKKCRKNKNVLWSRWIAQNDNQVSRYSCIANNRYFWGNEVQSGSVIHTQLVSHASAKCVHGNGSIMSQKPCNWFRMRADSQ